MAQLEIAVLGAFRVARDGRPLTQFDSAKVRALLAYLVIESDRPHAREKLAAMLWPEQADRPGRHSLSQALSNLRRTLGDRTASPPYLLTTRDAVQWNGASDFTLDAREFERRLAAVTRHRHDGQEPCPFCLEQLEKAVALYQGEFLEGLIPDAGEVFESWVLRRRGQLEQDAMRALHALAALYEARGEYEPARRAARRQIALDPLHEPGYQQLMRAYAWDGRRAAALRQYRELARLLQEELNTVPTDETTRLFEAIQNRSLSPPGVRPAHPPASGDPAEPEAKPVFVVREAQLAGLMELAKTATAGSGRLAFVTGEMGSGKTAVLQELAWRAQDEHAQLVVVFGSGNAHTGLGDPYLPFREILGQLTGDTSAQSGAGLTRRQLARLQDLTSLTGQALVTVGRDLVDTFIPGRPLLDRVVGQARMTPDAWAAGKGGWLAQLEQLVGRHAAEPGAAALDQARLFEQVVAVLQTVAAERPLLILLDDLQWADAGTTNLLFHLGRNLKHSRILVVGAYRAEEVALGREGQRHPLEPVLNEFRRAFGDIGLNLDAIPESENRRFVEAFIDSRPNRLSPRFREALYRQTDGHPLFIIELLRDLILRGDIRHDDDGYWVESDHIDWHTLPARVEGAIAERVGRLAPELQEILAIAAVEGTTFTAEVIAQVQSASEREIVRRLSHELNKQHNLVTPLGTRRVDGRRLSTYRFRHSLFQHYIYSRLDEAERAYLHEDVGQVLESLYGEQTGDIAAQLARHFQSAGQAARAVRYLREAGDRAMRLSAYREAAALFTQGLDLLRGLPAGAERSETELALQIALGIVHSVTRGFAATEVEHAFGRARALCHQIGAVPQLFPALWGLFYYYLVRAEDRAMRDLAEQLMQLSGRVEDPLLRPVGHWAKGVTLLYVGDLEGAHTHLEEMLTYYHPDQPRSAIFRYVTDPGVACHYWSAWSLWLRGYPDQSLNRSYEALALAQRLNHPFSLAFALFTSASLHQFRREPREALARAEAAIAIAGEHGFAFVKTLGEFFRGWAMTEQGDLTEGVRQMESALLTFQTGGSRIGLPHMLGLMAEARGRNSEPEEALTLLTEALTAARDTNERHYEPELLRLRGDLALAAGRDRDVAAGHYREAISLAQQQGARSWELRAMLSLCRLSAGAEEAAAHDRLRAVYNRFEEGYATPDLADAARLLRLTVLDARRHAPVESPPSTNNT